jgi:hypothetical protein
MRFVPRSARQVAVLDAETAGPSAPRTLVQEFITSRPSLEASASGRFGRETFVAFDSFSGFQCDGPRGDVDRLALASVVAARCIDAVCVGVSGSIAFPELSASVSSRLGETGRTVMIIVGSRTIEHCVAAHLSRRQANAVAVVTTANLANLIAEEAGFLDRYQTYVLVDIQRLKLREFWDAWHVSPPTACVVALGDTDAPLMRMLRGTFSQFSGIRVSEPSLMQTWSPVVHSVCFVTTENKLLCLLSSIQRTPPPVLVTVISRPEMNEVESFLQNASVPLGRDGVQIVLPTVWTSLRGVRHIVNYSLPKAMIAATLTTHASWFDSKSTEMKFVTTFVSKSDSIPAAEELKQLLQRSGQHVPVFLNTQR